MRHLRENLLTQFSIMSFVIMLILALAISQVLAAQLSQVIGLLQQHQTAMLNNPIDERAPFSIPSLEGNIRNLRWMVYGVVGGGFAVLYAGLVVIVWRGWKTIMRQRGELEVERDAALEANRMKSSFMISISHELRTPLNAIIGYSKLLQEKVEVLGPHSLQDDLDKIHSATQHLLGLINNLLDLSKIEAARVDVYLSPPDGHPVDDGS